MAVTNDSSEAVLRTLLVCDLVDSTRLTEELGDARAAELSARHDRVARTLLEQCHGREIDKTDGFLLLFERPINAVQYALSYHDALAALSREEGVEFRSRVGIHLGEVMLRENPAEQVALGAKPLEVEGLAKPTAARVMALADGGQTLLTRAPFDLARRAAVGVSDLQSNLRWLAHGSYLLKGVEEPVEVFEVGVEDVAPLTAPAGSAKAKRIEGDGTIVGWRPAAGLEVPQRPNWELIRKLGEGGFGEVWLATHRKTGDHRVFKFCYDAQSLRTLKRETTLFRLLKGALGDRHDIARILDWNFEEAPYFIESEYTEGGSFIEWSNSRGGLDDIPLKTRLEVVSQVADALGAAHSVGVLHKDVKPANILIATDEDDQPHALLTDFGIARITDEQRLAAAGITVLGLTEMRPYADYEDTGGTRLYMAPETIEGKPATVQGDIYALGVLLYQVIAGDFSHALAPGWRRDIDDELLQDDIAIAVDGDPARRLGNALRLAERLRGLDQRRADLEAKRREQQEAKQARLALVAARRRRKLMLAAIVVLTIFAGTMAILAQRIASERDRANLEARTSEQVADFLVSLFKVSDPGEARGNTITAREILDRGSEKISGELADQPQVQARLMDTMGTVYESLGLYGQAVPLLEEALATRRELYGDEHLEVAESETHLARVLTLKADYEGAESKHRRALAMRREELGDEHPAVAESLSGLAEVLSRKGDYVGAEELFREALDIRRDELGFGDLGSADMSPFGAQILPQGDTAQAELAQSLEDLGLNLFDQGNYDAAVPLLRESLQMRLDIVGNALDPGVAEVMNNLGLVQHMRGEYAEAESLYRDALEMKRRLYGEKHPEIATGLNNLALVLHDDRRYEAAETAYREVLAMQRELLGGEHPEVALALNNLAILLFDKGETDSAIELSRDSLEMYQRVLGEEHPVVARGMANLGSLLLHERDYEAAEPLLREAIAMRRRLLGDNHPNVARSQTSLADLLVTTGRYGEAHELAERATAIFAESLSADHWRTAVATNVKGASLAGLQRYDEAEPLLLESYAAIRANDKAPPIHETDALNRIVMLYELWDRAEEVAKYRKMLTALQTDPR